MSTHGIRFKACFSAFKLMASWQHGHPGALAQRPAKESWNELGYVILPNMVGLRAWEILSKRQDVALCIVQVGLCFVDTAFGFNVKLFLLMKKALILQNKLCKYFIKNFCFLKWFFLCIEELLLMSEVGFLIEKIFHLICDINNLKTCLHVQRYARNWQFWFINKPVLRHIFF